MVTLSLQLKSRKSGRIQTSRPLVKNPVLCKHLTQRLKTCLETLPIVPISTKFFKSLLSYQKILKFSSCANFNLKSTRQKQPIIDAVEGVNHIFYERISIPKENCMGAL